MFNRILEEANMFKSSVPDPLFKIGDIVSCEDNLGSPNDVKGKFKIVEVREYSPADGGYLYYADCYGEESRESLKEMGEDPDEGIEFYGEEDFPYHTFGLVEEESVKQNKPSEENIVTNICRESKDEKYKSVKLEFYNKAPKSSAIEKACSVMEIDIKDLEYVHNDPNYNNADSFKFHGGKRVIDSIELRLQSQGLVPVVGSYNMIDCTSVYADPDYLVFFDKSSKGKSSVTIVPRTRSKDDDDSLSISVESIKYRNL